VLRSLSNHSSIRYVIVFLVSLISNQIILTIFMYKLYLNWDREKSAEVVRKAERLGCKAIFVTVDSSPGGKRTRGKDSLFPNTC
jgi:isopentenyl diphosphate isomerase/L-lactate dehydrogenase-like FMN-dependent dehydrogenase